MRKKNPPTIRFLSIEEEISTKEDIKPVEEVMVLVPVAFVVTIFWISIPLKVPSLTAMNEKNTR